MTAAFLRASTAPAETPETGQTGVPLALGSWGDFDTNLVLTSARRAPANPASILGLAVPWGLGVAAPGELPLPAWGWQDEGCKHSPPLCQHYSGPTPVLRGADLGVPALCGKGLVARSHPGAVWGPCPLHCPAVGPVGAYPRAQPSVNSGYSACASPLAATLHDSGWRNPLSGLFPSELQPLAQPIFGAALVLESAGTSWNSRQALTQPQARTERGESPAPPIAEPPRCATTPGASLQTLGQHGSICRAIH